MNNEEALRPQPRSLLALTSDIFDLRWHNFSPKCECICELIESSSALVMYLRDLILAAILIVT